MAEHQDDAKQKQSLIAGSELATRLAVSLLRLSSW
jgi:hypothetical protein